MYDQNLPFYHVYLATSTVIGATIDFLTVGVIIVLVMVQFE